jgi:hypothetical protein
VAYKYNILGSLSVQKVREAILGKNGQNIEDLEHMTGLKDTLVKNL